MITLADLPAWLPSWEVLLTLFLSFALVAQFVSIVTALFIIIFAREDLAHLQQQLTVLATFIVLVTIVATTYFVGTKADSAVMQSARKEAINITLTPEESAELFDSLEKSSHSNSNAAQPQRLRFDINGNLIETFTGPANLEDIPLAPEGIDQEDWRYLTDEERALWQ